MSDHENIHQSKSNEWYTPAPYIEAARRVMGEIDLDPASSTFANHIVRAKMYYAIEDNGLEQNWKGRVWLNPPYGKTNNKSNQGIWLRKLIGEFSESAVTQAILLVNAMPSEDWFAPLWKFPICFTNHRIKFIDKYGNAQKNPTHGNCFVYLGSGIDRFVWQFSAFGHVVQDLRRGV